MKYHLYHLFLLLAIGLLAVACSKNEVLPDYALAGTSTATLAEISVSNDEPVAGEQVTVTLYYVNLGEDPAKQIMLLEKIGSSDTFTEIATLDESSASANAEVTRTFTYTVPAVPGKTGIVIDMVLRSQKEFPQRERVTLTVQ